MKKIVSILILCLLFVYPLKAQTNTDYIIDAKGTKYEVEIHEISADSVISFTVKNAPGRIRTIRIDRVKEFHVSDQSKWSTKKFYAEKNRQEQAGNPQRQENTNRDKYLSDPRFFHEGEDMEVLPTIVVPDSFISKAHHTKDIDTLYYDIQWKGVPEKILADYYRIIVFPKDSSYPCQFRDFYSSGEMQGRGSFVGIDRYDDSKSLFDGEVISYFKNGKEQKRAHFKDGYPEGEFTEFDENGNILNNSNFKYGKLSGIQTVFQPDGSFTQINYKAGKFADPFYYYGSPEGSIIKIDIISNEVYWDSPKVTDVQTEYRYGAKWKYYNCNGLMVAVTRAPFSEYGSYHKIDIIVTNNTPFLIELDPEKIVSPNTKVWSADAYLSKVSRRQTLQAMAIAMTESYAAQQAAKSSSATVSSGYGVGSSDSAAVGAAVGSSGWGVGAAASSSVSAGAYLAGSVTSSHNGFAAYQADVIARDRISNVTQAQWSVKQLLDQGYLKRTTIRPGESITGYFLVSEEDDMELSIPISGVLYRFFWIKGE